jgi:hypothetical protein
MKNLLVLFFIASLSYGQTIDTVKTTDTPNAGRIKLNQSMRNLKDTTAQHTVQISDIWNGASGITNLSNATSLMTLLMRQTDTTMMVDIDSLKLDVDTLETDITNRYEKDKDISLNGDRTTIPKIIFYQTQDADSGYVGIDLSGNIYIRDKVTGTKTLAELALPPYADSSGKAGVYISGAGVPSNATGYNGQIYYDTTNLFTYVRVADIWRQQP